MSARPSSFLLGGRTYSPAASLLLALPFLAMIALAFLLPLGMLLHESLFVPTFNTANYEKVFDQAVYLRVMGRTLRISALVTVITLLLAFPLAALMARTRGLLLALLLLAVLLPLWTSVLVRTYAWLVLLQRNGVLNDVLFGLRIISEPTQFLRTEGAVVLAMSHVLLPFMVLPLYSALRAIPAEYTRAAQMLGAGSFSVFRHVVLPLSLPGISSGCLMTFLLAIGFFVTPALIGGPQQMMLATLVQQQVTELLNWPFAGALVGVLLIFVLALVLLFNRVVRLDRFVGQL
jgi:mannopine transport system permease protein